jgi:hypothetical protein
MSKRIRLTAIEIEAVIIVARNALPWETFEGEDEETQLKMTEAYERGIDKLNDMLDKRKKTK